MNATPDRFATRLVRSVKSRMEMGALLGRQERPQHSEVLVGRDGRHAGPEAGQVVLDAFGRSEDVV